MRLRQSVASLLRHNLDPAFYGDHILDAFDNANGLACFHLGEGSAEQKHIATDGAPAKVGGVDALSIKQQGVDFPLDGRIINEVVYRALVLINTLDNDDLVVVLLGPLDGPAWLLAMAFRCRFSTAPVSITSCS